MWGKEQSKKTEPVPSESNRWLNLLKVLPENEDTLSGAYLSDGEYMLEKIPSSQYPIGLSIPLFGDCPGGCYDEEWKATLGFVSSDVHQVVYAGTLPMNIYQAARGDFNADEINIAARTGPGNEDVIIQSHAGYEYYSWGEDRAVNLTRRSHVRPLGRGHRLALVDDYVFWMLWTEGIEDMIGAYTDTIPSLADREDYKVLSGALEELDTVNAYFSDESQSLSHYYEVCPREKLNEELHDEIKNRLFEVLDYEPLLKVYRACATGVGKDEGGYYLAIVLLNEENETAELNAKLLEQRIHNLQIVYPPNEDKLWIDLIDEFSIECKGRLTIAKLYGEVVTCWNKFQILGTQPFEPLLITE